MDERLTNCPGLIVQNALGDVGWPESRRARRPEARWLRDCRVVPDLFFKMRGEDLGGLMQGELSGQELGG